MRKYRLFPKRIQGYNSEAAILREKIEEAHKRIKLAEDEGDRSENASLDSAHLEHTILKNELNRILDILDNSEVIDTKSIDKNYIGIGCIITLYLPNTGINPLSLPIGERFYMVDGEDEYIYSGDYIPTEKDLATIDIDRMNELSIKSPVGRLLLNRRIIPGVDIVHYRDKENIPREIHILDVDWSNI